MPEQIKRGNTDVFKNKDWFDDGCEGVRLDKECFQIQMWKIHRNKARKTIKSKKRQKLNRFSKN